MFETGENIDPESFALHLAKRLLFAAAICNRANGMASFTLLGRIVLLMFSGALNGVHGNSLRLQSFGLFLPHFLLYLAIV